MFRCPDRSEPNARRLPSLESDGYTRLAAPSSTRARAPLEIARFRSNGSDQTCVLNARFAKATLPLDVQEGCVSLPEPVVIRLGAPETSPLCADRLIFHRF